MTRQKVPEKKMDGIWQPENAGDKTQGEFLRMEDGKYGADNIILLDDGAEQKLPAHKWLQNQLMAIKPGNYVWIEFAGFQEKNGKATKTRMYNTDYDPDHIPKPRTKPLTEFPQPTQETMAQKESRFLAGLGSMVGGLAGADADIVSFMSVNLSIPVDQAAFLFGVLKQTGKIHQSTTGNWVRS